MLGRGIVTRSLARVDDPEIMGETGIRSSSTLSTILRSGRILDHSVGG